MSDIEHRQQKPSLDALREIRALLLTPNQEPRYPRPHDEAVPTRRPRKRLMRSRLRPN